MVKILTFCHMLQILFLISHLPFNFINSSYKIFKQSQIYPTFPTRFLLLISCLETLSHPEITEIYTYFFSH